MRGKNGFVIGMDTLIAIMIISSALVYFMYEYSMGIRYSSESAVSELGSLNAKSGLQNLLMLKDTGRISNSTFANIAESYGYRVTKMNISSGMARRGTMRLTVMDGKIYSVSG